MLTQVAYPLTTAATRDRLCVASVVLLATACACHAAGTRGPRTAAAMVLLTAGVGLLAELVGVRTGVPFGRYAYAPGRLGPVVGGVPVVIAAAWTVGAWPAWCAARLVARTPVARVLLATLGLVAWDLYLDPQMVADGRWAFTAAGPALPGLPGVPLTNLLGWTCVGLVVSAGLVALEHRRPVPVTPAGEAVPVALYLWTWLGSGLAHLVFLDLPVSGAYGLLGTGLLGVPLLRAVWSARRARPSRPPGPAHGPVRRPGRLGRWTTP